MIAGIAKVPTRSALLASEGQVLPSAWNRLEQVKTRPIPTKFQDVIRRYSPPTVTTSGSLLKARISPDPCHWQSKVRDAITAQLERAAARKVARTRSARLAP